MKISYAKNISLLNLQLLYFLIFILTGHAQILFAFENSESKNDFLSEQMKMDLDDLHLAYSKLQSKALSEQNFLLVVQQFQKNKVWNLDSASYLFDIYQKEIFQLKEPKSHLFFIEFCKMLSFYKEEFYETYMDKFDQCHFEKTKSPQQISSERFKIDGYPVTVENLVRRELIDAPYLLQYENDHGQLQERRVRPQQFPAEKQSVYGKSNLSPVAQKEAEFQKWVAQLPEPKPNFYERNKTWVWTAASIILSGLLIQQNYDISFQ